jgi:hypothetical protein
MGRIDRIIESMARRMRMNCAPAVKVDFLLQNSLILRQLDLAKSLTGQGVA